MGTKGYSYEMMWQFSEKKWNICAKNWDKKIGEGSTWHFLVSHGGQRDDRDDFKFGLIILLFGVSAKSKIENSNFALFATLR